jgi:hypothetical protein
VLLIRTFAATQACASLFVLAPAAHAGWHPNARGEIRIRSQMPPPTAFESSAHATVWGAVHALSYNLKGWNRPGYREFKVRLARGGQLPAAEVLQSVLARGGREVRRSPVMFFLPGLGGGATAGVSGRWVERFKNAGFHVVIFANPWSKKYLKNLKVSEPGSIEVEAEIVYEAITQTLRRLGGVHDGNVHLTGQSYGGLLAAAVLTVQDRLERASGKPGPINRAVNLFGPPLSLSEGARRFDGVFKTGWKVEDEQGCDLGWLDELRIAVRVARDQENKSMGLGDEACATYLIARSFQRDLREAARVLDERNGIRREVPARYAFQDFIPQYTPQNFARVGQTPEDRLDYWVCETSPMTRTRMRILSSEDDFLNEGFQPSLRELTAHGCGDGAPFADTLLLPWGGHLGAEGLPWMKEFTRKYLSGP